VDAPSSHISAARAGAAGARSAGAPAPGPELITSTGNSFIKHCVKLRESSKYRQEAGRVLVVGQTPIKELLGRGATVPGANSWQAGRRGKLGPAGCRGPPRRPM
jgi:hypothetical protein